jgi:hypothetical protein
VYYERNAAGRRAYLVKFGAAWLAAIVVAGVPVLAAMKAGAF